MPADMKPIAAGARRMPEEHHPARTIALRAVNDAAHGPFPVPAAATAPAVALAAAMIAIRHETPMVLTGAANGADTLPFTPFEVGNGGSLDRCLADGVARDTGHTLGHAEQLVTLADPSIGLAVGYLVLMRAGSAGPSGTQWRCWYDYLPWEDWSEGRPEILAAMIEPRLRAWAEATDAARVAGDPLSRADRVRMTFGLDRAPWNEERAPDRLDLLIEAGLLDGGLTKRAMRPDHLRILAHAVGRLRTKLKTRPVIFELMEPEFTLFELQKTVEAILGPHLHKQNFRRLIESAGLVEPTGEVRAKTGGRPAKLFRFRQEVLLERPAPGVRVHAQHG